MKTVLKFKFLLAGLVFVSACLEQGDIILVRKGKTDHAIIIDASAPESVKTAAKDLKTYFGKVTGAFPEIVLSKENLSRPYISLGNTAAARAAGLDASDIPVDGYRIVTRRDDIFILGPDTPDGQVNSKGGVSRGTSNGVYTFIEEYLGVRWLMPGEAGEEYSGIRTLKIPVTDRMENSKFDYRVLMYRDSHPLEEEWDRRMKLGKVAAVESSHSWIETVPPSLYDEHPEWFAMSNGKRVPPIGKYYKLESTNPELVQYFADRIIETFRNDPDRKWYSLSPSDGGGWSDSPESMALVERDRWGNLSRTPLVLSFYNDVARIVGKEFPDHMLGGLLYGNVGGYRSPPSSGLKIEPNLALRIPNGPCYGFRLYRDFARENWADSIYIPEWSELSKKYGFDIYYADYLITLIPPNGIICPPAPDLLNHTFAGVDKYGFKGVNIAGNPIWPVYGPGNYTLARLFWDPKQDAHRIQHEYYRLSYGAKAGTFIEKIYHLLDTAFSNYYARDHSIAWNLVEEHLEFIYAPHYREMEQYYLEALPVKKNQRQQLRLELFGQVLSLLQWTLRDYGYLSADYTSPLTLSDEQVDELLANQREDLRITRRVNYQPPVLKAEVMPALKDAVSSKAVPVPVARTATMVLKPLLAGEVTLTVDAFNKRAEFIQYFLTDDEGSELLTGAIAEGKTIRFNAEADKKYFLYVPCRKAFGKLKTEGAAIAYHVPEGGIHLEGSMMDESLPLYFYVPEGVNGFTIIMGGSDVVADVFSPGGKKAGQLNNTGRSASHVRVSGKNAREGFWKIVLDGSGGTAIITLDEHLPQWVTPDPARPLRIFPHE